MRQPSDTAPLLNWQRAEYLHNRLVSFRYPICEAPRTIHNTGHLSSQLTGAVAAALTGFYATQIPTPAGGDANKEGATIFRNDTKDIPVGRACHGEGAEGRGAVLRLAGQHKGYLRMQLEVIGMV